MSEIKRPQECVNAHCVAMCSPIDYEFWKGCFFDNPRKCPNYKTEPMIPISVIENIKTEIKEEIVRDDWDIGCEQYYNNAIKDCLAIIDKHISGKEK